MHLPTTALLLAALAAPLAHTADTNALTEIPRACKAMCAVVTLSTNTCGSAATDTKHNGLRRRAGELKVTSMGARGMEALCAACIGKRTTGGRQP